MTVAKLGETGLICSVFHQVHPSGKTFSANDGEGKTATIELNDPVSSVNKDLISNQGLRGKTSFVVLRL